MGMMAKKGHSGEVEENVFWTTMSNLMLGLAIVFMTLFVLAMTGFTQETIEMQQNQMKATEQLAERLQEAGIDADVDKLTGQVKISNLQLFEVNSWTLSPKGKAYLDKFSPIYINTIFTHEILKDTVRNIVIQGHTDSQTFAGLKTEDEQFVKNMDLSTKRANAVAEYMFKTNFNKEFSPQLRKMLVVEGRSFSDPILVDGKEDFDKSRRVELKLVVKPKNISRIFGMTFGGVFE